MLLPFLFQLRTERCQDRNPSHKNYRLVVPNKYMLPECPRDAEISFPSVVASVPLVLHQAVPEPRTNSDFGCPTLLAFCARGWEAVLSNTSVDARAFATEEAAEKYNSRRFWKGPDFAGCGKTLDQRQAALKGRGFKCVREN